MERSFIHEASYGKAALCWARRRSSKCCPSAATIKLNMTLSMTLNFVAITLAIIGTLNPVVGAGIYYLSKEKHDPESKKIYTVVSVIGGAVAIVCAVLLAVA